MSTLICDMILCSLIGKYQHYRGTYCLHLQGSRHYSVDGDSICWYLSTRLYGVKSQMT